jgi:hypothetical protein
MQKRDQNPQLAELDPELQVAQANAAPPRASSQDPAPTSVPETAGEKVPSDPGEKSEGIEFLRLPYEFADRQFSNSVFRQIFDACLREDGYDRGMHEALTAALRHGSPTDAFDLMLANQMAGINVLVMRFIGFLGKADNTLEIEAISNQLNKLARTFVLQMDARQRYRSGGEQKVTVQNVSVSDGGQAIVGNVTQNAADNDQSKVSSTSPLIAHAPATSMPIIEQITPPAKAAAKRRSRP